MDLQRRVHSCEINICLLYRTSVPLCLFLRPSSSATSSAWNFCRRANIRTLFRVITRGVAFASPAAFRACEFLLLVTRHFSRTESFLCRLGLVSPFALQPPNWRIDSDGERYDAVLWKFNGTVNSSLPKSDLSSFTSANLSFYLCVKTFNSPLRRSLLGARVVNSF